jgi:hypothetical protein
MRCELYSPDRAIDQTDSGMIRLGSDCAGPVSGIVETQRNFPEVIYIEGNISPLCLSALHLISLFQLSSTLVCESCDHVPNPHFIINHTNMAAMRKCQMKETLLQFQ